MATIIEVARKAGVSIGTVSNVIRGTARVRPALCERVQAAIRELDYHPNDLARSLKLRQTYMLGMLLPDITNPFFPSILRGAEEKALERGYLLVAANTDEQIDREKRILSALRSRRVDGILLVSAPGQDIDHIRAAVEAGIPIVCLDRNVPQLSLDCIMLDNVRGAQDCVRHLMRVGYDEIAIITGDLQLAIARERLNGYEEAFREVGKAVSRDLILVGDFRRESGYRLAKELLLRRHRPSAIFVSNGVMTLGVLQAFDEVGVRCPEDVGLATFDDLVGDHFQPRLTVVSQPGYEIGAIGAELLMDRIEGKITSAASTVRIPPALIVRDSTRTRTVEYSRA